MIHIISGKPRGGKTLYAVRLIIAELVFGVRCVFTNVPLSLPELNSYIQARWPGRSVDVVGRVFILSDEQTKDFYLYRPGWTGKKLNKDEWQSGRVPDYGGITDKGVYYAIDELHNFYGSRQWAEDGRGRNAMFYLSQHAHLGDTVIGITQAPKNVDATFRRIAQDFTVVRNLSKEKMGFFTLPGIFIRRTFFSEPTDLTPAQETKTFTLDVSGIAGCYRTAAGVGMHEAVDADKGEKAKGFPWWAGVAASCVVVFFVFTAGPKTLGHLFNPPSKKMAAVAYRPVQTNAPAHFDHAPTKQPEVIIGTNGLHVTGVAYIGDKMFVTLSDGRIEKYSLTNPTKKGQVLVDGKVLDLP